jgi:hypothetical protein
MKAESKITHPHRNKLSPLKQVMQTAIGKRLFGMALLTTLVGVPLLSQGEHREEADGNGTESKIQQGFEIAPVPLDLRGKNAALVGLGSYIVNSQGDCNSCHSTSANEFVPGGNPYLGEPTQIDQARYLIGGRQFGGATGPRSRNLTRDVNGLPAGYTFEEFLHVLRTGEDLKHLPPFVPAAQNDLLQAPMPWPVFRKMTDRDILAIYEYLRSIPSHPGFPQ